MSVLEFIAAIKWPLTVLILAGFAAIALRRSPQTRGSIAAWLHRRNLRLHLAGQEFEATVAETQGSIDAAISPDPALTEAVARTPEGEEGQHRPERIAAEKELENARRQAVADVARNAVRLGWQWGRGEQGASEPMTAVSWDDAGHPSLRVFPQRDAEVQDLVERFELAMAMARLARLRSSPRNGDGN